VASLAGRFGRSLDATGQRDGIADGSRVGGYALHGSVLETVSRMDLEGVRIKRDVLRVTAAISWRISWRGAPSEAGGVLRERAVDIA
jgi:hypothetical protein